MTTTADTAGRTPWWTEPTKDQWMAWIAAWLGWTLDAFDFTIFLLLMVPIANRFAQPSASESCQLLTSHLSKFNRVLRSVQTHRHSCARNHIGYKRLSPG